MLLTGQRGDYPEILCVVPPVDSARGRGRGSPMVVLRVRGVTGPWSRCCPPSVLTTTPMDEVGHRQWPAGRWGTQVLAPLVLLGTCTRT